MISEMLRICGLEKTAFTKADYKMLAKITLGWFLLFVAKSLNFLTVPVLN